MCIRDRTSIKSAALQSGTKAVTQKIKQQEKALLQKLRQEEKAVAKAKKNESLHHQLKLKLRKVDEKTDLLKNLYNMKYTS